MKKKGRLTKMLAVAGTVLVWVPILAPILFSAFRLLRTGPFMFDYLMPAELFPLALVGGGLLAWGAQQAGSRRKIIDWGLVGAIGLLVGGQALAMVTGLASGETEPEGWIWALVAVSLAMYTLAVIVMGVGGVLLLRDVFGAPRQPGEQG
jgi:hypothetical protein